VDGSRRLSQAISEGDGISLIAVVRDVAAARAAQEEGAEALALVGAVGGIREASGLPVLFRVGDPQAAHDAGADACLIVVEDNDDEGRLEELHAGAVALGLEVVVDVHDEESLGLALERIDPEIILLSSRDADDDEPRPRACPRPAPGRTGGKARNRRPARVDARRGQRARARRDRRGAGSVARRRRSRR
jgi:hypothetical protein